MNTTRNTLAALVALSLTACTQSPDNPTGDSGLPVTADAATEASPDDAAIATVDAGIPVDDTATTPDDAAAVDAGADAGDEPDASTDFDAGMDFDAGDPPADDGGGADDASIEPPDPRPTCVGDDHQVDGDGAESRYPRVAFTGSDYGIVFQDDRDGDQPGANWELYFARVSAAGDVASVTRITHDPAADTHPALAWDGTRFWVTWVRVTSDGSSYALTAMTVTPQGGSGLSLGAEATVSENGAGIDRPNVQAIPAASGGGVGVAWQDARNGMDNWEIYYARLGGGTGGVAGGDAGAGAATDAGTGTRTGGDGGVNGGGDAGGVVVGGAVRVTNAPRLSAFPLLAWNSAMREFGLVWEDDRDGHGPVDQPNEDLYFTRVLADGARPSGATDVKVTDTAGRSLWPALSYTGPGYAMSWAEEDETPDLPHVYFARFDARGQRDAAEPDLKVSSNRTTDGAWTSAVGWNGREYTLAWEDQGHPQGDVAMRRLAPDLTSAAAETFLNDDAAWSGYVNMARGDGGYLITWEDNRAGHRDVWFRFLTDDACR